MPHTATSSTPIESAVTATLSKITLLRNQVRQTQRELLQQWQPHIVLPTFHDRAANLAAYIGLRRHDLRPLQRALACYGLSSLGRCEGHVIPSLDAVANGLTLMSGQSVEQAELARVSAAIEHDEDLLHNTTNALFGAAGERSTRFMVTLPSQAADDPAFVRELLNHGMDCARINCAHDNRAAWLRMARHIRRAEKQTGRTCRIFMDLAGPKLRTGPIRLGPDVLHIKVQRDIQPASVTPASLVLTSAMTRRAPRGLPQPDLPRVHVAANWLQQLQIGDRITLRDARGRKRVLHAQECLSNEEWRVTTKRSMQLTPTLQLTRKPAHKSDKKKPVRTPIRRVPPAPQVLYVADGELILMTRDTLPGGNCAIIAGHQQPITHFCCQEPRLFEALNVGQRLYIDDGKISTLVEKIDEAGAWLRVQHTRSGRARIQADKGINVPDTALNFGALTDKDLTDLDFVAAHADIVGLSFVRQASDIVRLSQELATRGAPSLALVAKIETADAVRNLPEIIVQGAGRHPFGVMIARGDLAVEIGYARLAEIQEEIMWLCEAAHVPVIWATQVLESLVKKGFPSRAEITDAATSGRAECVMLNKGPHVLEALNALNSVITRMQAHQTKKTAQFRALHW